MSRNLTNLYISESFQYLIQTDGAGIQTGLGSAITSVNVTASNAVSSSYSNTSTSASYALVSTTSSFAINANSASYAVNATSASYALTASFALNAGATVSTASLLTTASAVNNVITFTKGDGSTFPVTVATGSAVSASYATTASLALLNVLTASNTNATITYTKGDGTTFTNVINNVVNATSASVATSASYAISASQAQNAVSASYYGGSVVSASYATTASFAQNIANGLSPTFANVTASNVMITGTASVALLYTQTISSSVIYSSGSNQFGDASNDVQTLYGTFNVVNGPSNFTGSVNSLNGFTGSLAGTASFATSASQAVSSSFATTASFALNVTPTNTGSLLVTASAAGNVITFTKGDASTFNVTVATGSASAFPYTGSAGISGSLTVIGDFTTASGSVNLNRTYTYFGGANADSTFVGNNAGQGETGGYENTAFGKNAGKGVGNGGRNTYIGKGAGESTNSTGVTAVGSDAANSQAGNDNVFVGRYAGYVSAGSNNVILGADSGFKNNGDNNILIGKSLAGQFGSTFTANNKVAIGSDPAPEDCLIYGDHEVGGANRFLKVNGNFQVSGSLEITGSTNVQGDLNVIGAGYGSNSIVATTIKNNVDGIVDIFASDNISETANLQLLAGYGGQYYTYLSYNNNNLTINDSGSYFTGEAGAISGSFSGSFLDNITDVYTSSPRVNHVVTLTQAEYNAIGTPDANTMYVISGSLANATVGSNTFTGNQVFSGSVRGVVISGSTTSNTASLDFSAGNFFTLNTNNVLNTHIVPTNVQSGQTINLELTFPNTASAITFPSFVKQPSGSAYTPSGANTTDILTFIVFNTGSVYLSSVKNLI